MRCRAASLRGEDFKTKGSAQQTGDGRGVDFEEAGDVSGGLVTVADHLECDGLLVGGQL